LFPIIFYYLLAVLNTIEKMDNVRIMTLKLSLIKRIEQVYSTVFNFSVMPLNSVPARGWPDFLLYEQ